MKFYHYTSWKNWRDIQSGERNGKLELMPRKRFIPLSGHVSGLPDKAHDGAIFGLIDPMDTAWCKASWGVEQPLLELVLRDIDSGNENELCLLEVSVTPQDDIHVADYSPHMDEDYNGFWDSHPKVLQRVKKAYWESLVPFGQYVEQGRQHQLAEVICFSPIPLERVRLHKVCNYQRLMNHIRKIAGLPARPYPKRRRPNLKALEDLLASAPK